MKKIIRIISLIMVSAMLMTATAFAQVVSTASVKIRKGPGLNYEMIDAVVKNTYMTYKGSTKYDNRGVAWYKVGYKDKVGWVSSKYTVLNDIGGSSNSSEWNNNYIYGAGYLGDTSFNAGWFGEYDTRDYWFDLSDVMFTNLKSAAEYIGLAYYESVPYSEAPNQYGNKWITIGGHKKVEYIDYCGGPYRLYGVDLNMESEIAGLVMMEYGLHLNDFGDDYMLFERLDPNGNGINEYDSCLYLYEENGYVARIIWCAYSG